MSQFHCALDQLVMVTRLCLGVTILAVVAANVANADISVDCLKDSVKITWKVSPEVVPRAARLFLGNCMPSHLSVLSTGEGEAQFTYKLNECKFRRLMKGKRLLYQNELTFRLQAKPKPAAFTYPIECVYKRPEGWVPPFLSPGSGVAEGHGGLVFHMALLNEELSGVATTNIIPLGSFIPIWAAVEQKSHQPLLLLLEECVAATTPELQPGSQVYPIITNKGCLLDGKRGNSRFLPRYHSSAIILYLQSFKFHLGEEVYIHCKLVAWDPDVLDQSKKACHYVKESGRWELLDDPFQNALCSCCDSTCKSRSKRGVESESQGLIQNSVFGPLIIVDRSDTRTHNMSVKSLTAEQGKAQSKLAVGSLMDPAQEKSGNS
ncbi:zona pellucida sperm-binding protein 3-like [Centroberyx affinis]|uniref:zona pellucida sperm-binding protein 3-like n=1 Tax=Centroberyx affinis TaxID=166261 RepID=UPI003A5BC98C